MISGGRARKHDSFERRQRRHCLALGFNLDYSLGKTTKVLTLIRDVDIEVELMARLAPHPPSHAYAVDGIANRAIPPIDRATARKGE